MRSRFSLAVSRRLALVAPMALSVLLAGCPSDDGGDPARTPTSITVSAGNNQDAQVSTAVPIDPAVLVEDADGPIPGISVTFAVTGGGGTIQGSATVQTNASGVATVGGWVLGPNVGPNTLSATAAPLAAITFNATGVATAAVLQFTAGNVQSAFAGNFVPTLPIAQLTNGGAPVVGATIAFAVTQGGGTVKAATAVTDAQGNANPISWRLGGVGAQTISASVPADPAVPAATANATATAVPASQYNIVIEFLGTPPSPSQQAAFTAAATRWSQVVVGDLQPFSIGSATAAQCGADTPSRANVDDVHIFAVVEAIDGSGGILAQAGPCFIRPGTSTTPLLAVSGVMIFDVADANDLEAAGLFDETVLHEMGHVLGFGTQWGPEAFGFDMLRPTTCASQGYFRGVAARQPFLTASTTGLYPRLIVPVEDNAMLPCPGGTRDGHWKEEAPTLDDELMTGFIEAAGTPMPLSAFTAASLRDLGYTVNDAVADPFTFVPPLTLRLMQSLERSDIPLGSDMLFPYAEVDQSGRILRTFRH